jgi:alginate O-acetyltransferase complex protein AlgI
MMLFPTYLSGPMDRYGRFRRDFENPLPLTQDAAAEACWRIVLGLFKKTVLSAACAPFAYAAYTTPALGAISAGKAWVAVYAYAFLLYFDFSGYSDLAIGSARLFGIAVPENFRNPYFKRNIIEFWTSWHITLSTWLRDYLFVPIGKALMKRKRRGGGNLPVALASYLVTFAIAGIWHGDGWNFLAWGVWHGLGLSACKAYGEWSRRLPAGYHRFMLDTFPGKALSTIVTFHFVILSWTLFANDLPRAAIVYRRLLGIG